MFAAEVAGSPVAADIVADVVEDIVCIVDKFVEDCSSDVCEFNSVLGIDDDDADCCCGNAGSSVNRNAISKSRNTSVSLDSIKLKRLQTEKRRHKKKKKKTETNAISNYCTSTQPKLFDGSVYWLNQLSYKRWQCSTNCLTETKY